MVVTAEPYFAVSQPSDAVVMENVIRKYTSGKVEEIDAKYELLQRGQYTVNVLTAELKPLPLDKNTPLDLYEARNAVCESRSGPALMYPRPRASIRRASFSLRQKPTRRETKDRNSLRCPPVRRCRLPRMHG
jgi:hypothetical protein